MMATYALVNRKTKEIEAISTIPEWEASRRNAVIALRNAPYAWVLYDTDPFELEAVNG